MVAVEGGWQVGEQNGGHGLYVGNAAGLPWYFVDHARPLHMSHGYDGSPRCRCRHHAAAVAGPPPPVGVPTKDEALAKAGEFFKVLGIDAKSFSITANASEYSTDVQAVPNLDGITAQGQMSSFNFGGEGKLQFANGFLVAPDKADSYPRIGTLKAFELLKTGSGTGGYFVTTASAGASPLRRSLPLQPRWTPPRGRTARRTTQASGDPPPQARCACPRQPQTPPASANHNAVRVESLRAAATHDRCRRSADVAVGDHVHVDRLRLHARDHDPSYRSPDATTAAPPPACPEPTPPEPVTITITGVHETLLNLMGADGSMWLVPGYEFTSTDGGTWPVLAIDQSFVDQVAPALPVPETAVAMGSSPRLRPRRLGAERPLR